MGHSPKIAIRGRDARSSFDSAVLRLYGSRGAAEIEGGAGVEGHAAHLPVETDRLPEISPTHLPTSMRNLAAPEGDRRFGRKLTVVGVHPDGLKLFTGGIHHAIAA